MYNGFPFYFLYKNLSYTYVSVTYTGIAVPAKRWAANIESNGLRLCGDNMRSKTDYWKLCQHLSQLYGDSAESANLYWKMDQRALICGEVTLFALYGSLEQAFSVISGTLSEAGSTHSHLKWSRIIEVQSYEKESYSWVEFKQARQYRSHYYIFYNTFPLWIESTLATWFQWQVFLSLDWFVRHFAVLCLSKWWLS